MLHFMLQQHLEKILMTMDEFLKIYQNRLRNLTRYTEWKVKWTELRWIVYHPSKKLPNQQISKSNFDFLFLRFHRISSKITPTSNLKPLFSLFSNIFVDNMKQFTKGCNLVQYTGNTTWFCSYEDAEHAPAILQQLFQKLVELSKEHWLIIDAGKIEFIISPDHSKKLRQQKTQSAKRRQISWITAFCGILRTLWTKIYLTKIKWKIFKLKWLWPIFYPKYFSKRNLDNYFQCFSSRWCTLLSNTLQRIKRKFYWDARKLTQPRETIIRQNWVWWFFRPETTIFHSSSPKNSQIEMSVVYLEVEKKNLVPSFLWKKLPTEKKTKHSKGAKKLFYDNILNPGFIKKNFENHS